MNINLTLIGQAISFAMFVAFCMKFVWPPLIGALRERQATIAEGLASAEKGAQAQEVAETEAKQLISDAKTQASEIVSQAQRRSNEIVEEAKTSAVTESDKVKASAQAALDQEVISTREGLRGEVSSVAMTAASKILKREVDAKTHASVLDELIAKI